MGKGIVHIHAAPNGGAGNQRGGNNERILPLAKKFGKRNVTLAGFILYAIGGAICWAFPIKHIGGLPCASAFLALFADVLDHLEWKTGFRPDGVAMSVYNIIAVAMVGICTGVFNGLLGSAGYIAPEIVNGVTMAAAQSDTVTVKVVITFGFVGLEVFTGVLLALLLVFLNVENGIEKKQTEIKAREEK